MEGKKDVFLPSCLPASSFDPEGKKEAGREESKKNKKNKKNTKE